MEKKALIMWFSVWAATFLGCSSHEKQKTYCVYQKVPCKSREQMQKDVTYIDGSGEVVSFDEGPWTDGDYVDDFGGADCCYTITYKPEPP